MSQRNRHEAILGQLGEGREVAVADLAREFRVDAVTIRRDLAHLASRGLLRRTRGGAVASRGGRIEFQFGRSRQTHRAEKAAIARAAVALVT